MNKFNGFIKNKWHHSIKAVGSSVLVVTLVIGSSITFAQTPEQQPNGGKAAFLLPLITSAFSGAFSNAASTLFGNIFNRIFNPVTCWAADVGSNQPAANCSPVNAQSNNSNNGNAGTPAFNAQTTQPATQMSADQAREKLAQAPAFTLKIDKLSSDQQGATVLSGVEFRKQSGTNDLTYDISTGEVFAMRFQTTVPGRIRIHNEQAGQTSQIGYYEVIPESENRMPRNRGFKINPPAGTEYLHIEFTPCVSSSMQTDSRIAAFSPYLAACSTEAATKQFASGKYVPPAGSKAIVNLDSPDPTQPVVARELNKGETLIMKIVVNHTAPGGTVSAPAVAANGP